MATLPRNDLFLGVLRLNERRGRLFWTPAGDSIVVTRQLHYLQRYLQGSSHSFGRNNNKERQPRIKLKCQLSVKFKSGGNLNAQYFYNNKCVTSLCLTNNRLFSGFLFVRFNRCLGFIETQLICLQRHIKRVFWPNSENRRDR